MHYVGMEQYAGFKKNVVDTRKLHDIFRNTE